MNDPQHTIVVADAEASFRSFLGGLLRPRGLVVLEARGIWDVWPLIEEHQISLFVIDAQVPDLGGLALVTEMRKRRIATPILFVASKWQGVEEHGRLTNKLGVQRVLHKPFSAYQFIMEVESTLESPTATIAIPPSVPPPDEDDVPVPRRLVSEPSMAAVDLSAPSSSSQGNSLLIIGDNAALQPVLDAAAHTTSISLTYAKNADDGARLLQHKPMDGALVLLDTDDPDTGFAEATELLCSDVGKGFPIGFVSQTSDVSVRVNAIHAGGVVHLTPPFLSNDLTQAVNAMAQVRRERQARIVVVADQNRGAELAAVLHRAGMQVNGISDAYRLIDYLSTTTPDLILFDIDLAGVSGLDVCKLLRASPSWRALALMLIATRGSSEARIAAFDAGADDFLVKPLSEEELVARVEARVRRHRVVRESADKDPLTGLLQRHAFVERARTTLAAARRNAEAVAFCLIRVDDWQAIRETHDQLTSERIVLQVGRVLAELLRDYDLRTRWDESELLLALVDVDGSATDPLFARLAQGLSAVRVPDDRGQLIPLSFSAALAAHPDDAQSLPALVRLARKRLQVIVTCTPQP